MSITLNIINGIPFTPFIDQKKVDELTDFPLLSDDLFVVTYPKSGTTWVQQIVALIQRGGVLSDSHLFNDVPWIEVLGRDAVQALPSPRTLKSHNPYHMMAGTPPAQSVAKYIYIARDPKDVAVSFYYHTLHFSIYNFTGDWNCYFEFFMKGEVDFGLWFDHVLEWWKHKDADNILFLKYEDMKKDLPESIKIISQFMGYNLEPALIDKIAEQSTFESMKANPLANPESHEKLKGLFNNDKGGSFLRKGVVGDWRNHFSDEQSARLDAEYAKRMTGSGLEFN